MISRNRRVILSLVLSVAAAGCDKLPLLAPTASTITLFAGSNTLQANGSMSITATVLESSGTPVQNGTLVSFTTTVGQITPSEARTQNGQVNVTLSGNGQSGEAQIQANSGGAKLTAPLTIKVGGAAASRIQLTANSSSCIRRRSSPDCRLAGKGVLRSRQPRSPQRRSRPQEELSAWRARAKRRP